MTPLVFVDLTHWVFSYLHWSGPASQTEFSADDVTFFWVKKKQTGLVGFDTGPEFAPLSLCQHLCLRSVLRPCRDSRSLGRRCLNVTEIGLL